MPIETGVVFWSHDKGTAKLMFQLRKDEINQSLAEGTIVPICLDFYSTTAENGTGRHIYHALIEDALSGIVSITLEDNILGYQGRVNGSIYIELPDSRSLDTAGRFTFDIRRSPIDETIPELEDYYWQGFNEIIEQYHETINEIKTEAAKLLDNLSTDIRDAEAKVNQLEQSIETNNVNLNTRIDELNRKIDDNDVYTKRESDANVIYQVIGKEQTKINVNLDYQDKITGSVIENPHKVSVGYSSVLPTPYQVTGEVSQNGYNALSALDEKFVTPSSSTNQYITYLLIQWNVIEALERELGLKFFENRGATTTKEKVEIAREILTGINPAFWGYGKSPSGNKLNFQIWINNSSWAGTRSHSASTVTKMEYNSTGASTNNYISDDGYLYALAYTQPSDGTTTSVLTGDYTNLSLQIEISVNNHIESTIAANHVENTATIQETTEGQETDKHVTPAGVQAFFDNVNKVAEYKISGKGQIPDANAAVWVDEIEAVFKRRGDRVDFFCRINFNKSTGQYTPGYFQIPDGFKLSTEFNDFIWNVPLAMAKYTDADLYRGVAFAERQSSGGNYIRIGNKVTGNHWVSGTWYTDDPFPSMAGS